MIPTHKFRQVKHIKRCYDNEDIPSPMTIYHSTIIHNWNCKLTLGMPNGNKMPVYTLLWRRDK